MTDIELTADERQELTTLLCSLIQHPSENPPGNEKAVALFIADVLRGEGIDVEVQEAVEERPNVIARLKGQWCHAAQGGRWNPLPPSLMVTALLAAGRQI